MKFVGVLQHTDAEYLGLVEDHLEGRNIGFRYIRPAHDPNWIRKFDLPTHGLIVLGSAPYGTVSSPKLPVLQQRVDVIKACLDDEIPVIAFGTGTQLLSLAVDSTVTQRALTLSIETAHRQVDDALNGFLPKSYPLVVYMTDIPDLPREAKTLATTESGEPALFQIGNNNFGFLGHPGIKRGMIEDSFVQMPAYALDDPSTLLKVSACQQEVQQSLVGIMTGLIQSTGWMRV